jgi:hypothetical protein
MADYAYKHLGDIQLFGVNGLFPDNDPNKPMPRLVLAMKVPVKKANERHNGR